MSDSASATTPLPRYVHYFGYISKMPDNSSGCITPNDLRHDGKYFYIDRATRVECIRWDWTPLIVKKVNNELLVSDEHVFTTDRWWNFKCVDTFDPTRGKGAFQVQSIIRGKKLDRKPTESGRIRGDSFWGTEQARFAGLIESMPVGTCGFVHWQKVKTDMGRHYILGGTTVYPTLAGENCFQVIHRERGIYGFKGDIPKPSLWSGSRIGTFCARFQTRQPTPLYMVYNEDSWLHRF